MRFSFRKSFVLCVGLRGFLRNYALGAIHLALTTKTAGFAGEDRAFVLVDLVDVDLVDVLDVRRVPSVQPTPYNAMVGI